MNDRTRIHMEVPPSFRELCEKVAEYSNAQSLTEMFRRAVRIYARLMWALRGGKRLAIIDEDGKVVEFIVAETDEVPW